MSDFNEPNNPETFDAHFTEEPGTTTPSDPVSAVSPNDERTWAVVAHLSIFLNLITGFLGLLPPLILYYTYRDRSRYIAYQSLQALIFQLVFWVGGGLVAGAFWVLTGITSLALVGLCCIPVAVLLSLVPVGAYVYAVLAAIDTSKGVDFKYWMVGDWTRSTYTD